MVFAEPSRTEMCDCLSLLITPLKLFWGRALMRLFLSVRSFLFIVPAMEVKDSLRLQQDQQQQYCGGSSLPTRFARFQHKHAYMSHKGKMYVIKRKHDAGCSKDLVEVVEQRAACVKSPAGRYWSNGGSAAASLFTRQGLKGANQDAMLVWENFTCQGNIVFCGVFDGHGPAGHLVARNVRDMLPQTLASCWQSWHQAAATTSSSSSLSSPSSSSPSLSTASSSSSVFSDDNETDNACAGAHRKVSPQDACLATAWKASMIKAYKLMDRDLLLNERVDCVNSGTTAVTLVKQGNDLILGNVGDSRAVLGTRNDKGSLIALQLTVDLKPHVQREADRIRRLKGRVFALQCEPAVKRVWLPSLNVPGLAMTRTLGDYCLKNHGVISEPEVTHRRLTKKDEFVVLATDGVWDVLSNEQVVNIVASTSVKSSAAKAVVDRAAQAWRSKHASAKADDCAAVCLFLDQCAAAAP